MCHTITNESDGSRKDNKELIKLNKYKHIPSFKKAINHLQKLVDYDD